MMIANKARGEVALQVGKPPVDLVICCTMEGLAKVSAVVSAPTLSALYQRIVGAEPIAMHAVLETWTVQGEVAAALDAYRLPDLPKIARAAAEAMAHHMEGEDVEPGKSEVEAAGANV